jgi:hypothetical protein
MLSISISVIDLSSSFWLKQMQIKHRVVQSTSSLIKERLNSLVLFFTIFLVPSNTVLASMVMQCLAIIKEEKHAVNKCTKEEYLHQLDSEDKFYLEKQDVLLKTITVI